MSSSQIIFFEKSAADYSYSSVLASAADNIFDTPDCSGNPYAPNVLNRTNTSAWITTGSADSFITKLTIDMAENKKVSEILLIKHNFKNFTVQYWNGSAYVDFSPVISSAANAVESNWYTVVPVETSKIQITVNSTQIANAEKFLYQFIATNKIGKFRGWPQIKKPLHNKNKIITQALSGKSNISDNVGAFSCDLEIKVHSDGIDLALIESLYDANDGFLVWLCGGDTSQFKNVLKGYRIQDLYLMRCTNNYVPEFIEGLYRNGIKVGLSLDEVTD